MSVARPTLRYESRLVKRDAPVVAVMSEQIRRETLQNDEASGAAEPALLHSCSPARRISRSTRLRPIRIPRVCAACCRSRCRIARGLLGREPSGGFCENFLLNLRLTNLATQPYQLLSLCCRQSTITAAGVAICLLHPAGDGPCGHTEFTREL